MAMKTARAIFLRIREANSQRSVIVMEADRLTSIGCIFLINNNKRPFSQWTIAFDHSQKFG